MVVDKRHALMIMVCSSILAFGSAAMATDYSSWADSATITLSTTTAGVATDQTNFPVLIRLVDGSNGFSFSQILSAGGGDIRFTDTTGADLSYQIERCTSPNLEVWVLVPTVRGTASGLTTNIKMHWGKAGQTTTGSGGAVFSPANGFMGVYHLSEGGTGTRYNSAQNLYNGTPLNYDGTESCNGDVAFGDSLKAGAGTDGINLGTGIVPTGSNITLSAWAKPHTFAAYGKIIQKTQNGTNVAPYQIFGLEEDGTGTTGVVWLALDVNGAEVRTAGTKGMTTDQWNYLAGTYDGNTENMYLNAAANGTATTPGGVLGTATEATLIGYNDAAGQGVQRFNGVIDEVRIENVTRSADWIKLCYQNQQNVPIGGPGQLVASMTLSDIRVTSQPQPLSIPTGAQASFAVAATAGGGETITYQWQKSTDGVTWNLVSTGATCTYVALAGDNGAMFRCYMTNTTGSVYSQSAILTICTLPNITLQPVQPAQPVVNGNSVTLSVAASGTGGAFTYLWQQSKDGGTTWPNATGTGVTSGTFISAGLTSADNNSQFRCQVSNGCGSPVTSTAVTVTVCTPPSIAANGQPVGWAGIAGSTASFSVVLTPGFSTPVTYQWQRGGAGNWANVPTGNGSGTTATYSFVVQQSDNGAQFQCLVTGPAGPCGTPVVTSSTAVASVCSPPGSTMVSPLSQSVTAGQAVTFRDSASGGGPYHYQWYYSTNGTTWTVTSAGDTLATLSFAAQASQSGYSYNCQVTNGCGTTPATSAAATLTVCTPPNILVAPGNASINVGDSAMFSVSATGSNLQYQWLRLNGTWAPVTVGIGGTSATYKFLPVPPGDNGAQFRVVVYNACANPATDTLGPVSLAICTPPVITTQPVDENVNPGVAVTFTTAATGTNITYQWQRGDALGLTWTPIANATATSYVITPAVADNGAQFRCSITGKCGSAVLTRAARLTVCVPVTVTPQTNATKSVLVGQTVSFSVAAQGTSVKYLWQKSSGAGAFASVPADTVDSVSFVAAQTDSGTAYRCIVTGQCGGPDTSATGFVQVYTPVHAVFGQSATAGAVSTAQPSLAVAFTDSSSGAFTNRVWNFGDGKIDTATATDKTETHTFTIANGVAKTFTVTLTVSGPGGADSTTRQVFVYPLGGDPIQMSGIYASATKVFVTFSNFGAITPPSPLVGPDSVGIWYTLDTLPQTPANAKYLRSYLVSTLKSKGTSTYSDTLTVPPVSGKDSAYGFMNGIFWSDNTKSTFSSGNGTVVLMKDTMPIVNTLTISGQYAPDDTALVFLGNANLVDTTRVDSVLLWYSLTGATTPNFADTVYTTRLNAKTVAAAGTGDTLRIVNAQFNNAQTTIAAVVMLVGKNGRKSDLKTVSFQVGKQRPVNQIQLRALAQSSTSIRLSWNSVAGSGVERVVIWYRSGSPIPLQYDLSALKLDSLTPLVTDTVITSSRFTPQTRYYFGAQVYANGQWSYVTANSSATDSTWANGAPLSANKTAITSLVFDTTADQIKVCWTADSAVLANNDTLPQLAVLYSTDSVPGSVGGNPQVVDIQGKTGCAYVTLRENLVFNKMYYVSLWLRAANSAWTPPSLPSGKDSVYVPIYKWQAVTLFSKAQDTVFAFNNQLRFANQPNDQSNVTDTIFSVAVIPHGIVQVSAAFAFSSTGAAWPFSVGLKIDSIPKGYTAANIRIYRVTAQGLWYLDPTAISIDSLHGYVAEITNNLLLPFVAGIDTVSPTITALSGSVSPVASGVTVVDSFSLRDNIANLSWKFLSAKGGESFATGDTSQSGVLSDTLQTIVDSIPGRLVSQDNGVRAILVVTDGVHVDTIDVSRMVVRDSSGIQWTGTQTWTPMSPTVVLDTPDVQKVLLPLAGATGSWKYDNTKFRIFRWYPTGTGAALTSKWVEYADAVKHDFDFTRGNLIWVKTKTRTQVTFGRGVTPSLTQPYIITIPAGQSMDVSLPFNFDIAIADIMSATRDSLVAAGGDTARLDSLQIFDWKVDKTGRYISQMLFDKDTNDAAYNNALQPLSSSDPAGFNLLNKCGSALRIVIPPVPQAMSTSLAKKAAKPKRQVWGVVVSSTLQDSSELSPVYCGFSKSASGAVSYFPAGPSLGNTALGVFDRGTRRLFGHAMAHSIAEGGFAFLLAFCNDAQEKQTFTYHLDSTASIPSGMLAAIYNDVTGAFEDMSKGPLTLAVDQNSTGYRWVFVGTKAYLAKASIIARPALLKLFGTYPNPFRSLVHIRYALPYEGIDRLAFAIFDMRGKTVWQTEMKNVTAYGTSELTWNGRSQDGRPVAAGVYVLRMMASGPSLKHPAVFDKKMTFVP